MPQADHPNFSSGMRFGFLLEKFSLGSLFLSIHRQSLSSITLNYFRVNTNHDMDHISRETFAFQISTLQLFNYICRFHFAHVFFLNFEKAKFALKYLESNSTKLMG